LADRTLQRLRHLASGNGLEPASVECLEKQESTFTFGGLMEVTPWSETKNAAYPGPVRAADRRMVANFAALAQAVAQHQQQFREKPDWIAAVTEELKKQEGAGWGLNGAKLSLPERSVILAATEACPSCQGRKTLTCEQCQGAGMVVCTQCQGEGRELCYHCMGRGEDPQSPGQRCSICHGQRYAPCRFCQEQRQLTCPTCHGRRGTPCVACQGQGQISQEIAVTCGGETHFKLLTADLPSGLRRGLDRVGIPNLRKGGHADIEAAPPAPAKDAPPQEKPPFAVLSYTAKLPYAELRMGFAGAKKRVVVSAFGKRCFIMGVPPFLDGSLKPWLDKLKLAATGAGPLEPALEARALREIMGLVVSGKARIEEARRLYPYGLSPEVLKAILYDLRLALNRVTLKTRSALAVASVVVSAFMFHLAFDGGWFNLGMAGRSAALSLVLTLLFPGLLVGAAWAGLSLATRFVLKKRFPNLPLAAKQKIGKTGLAMVGGTVAAFLLFLLLAPVKPFWLAILMLR
jgi:hypothetical protein